MVRIVGEIGEKLLELGQHVGDQVQQQVVKGGAQSAKTQILGQDKKPPRESGRDEFKEMLGDLTKLPEPELAEAKKDDLKERVAAADKVRANLQAEIIKRKQGIDEQIQRVRLQKQQEIPKYLAGKPGEAKTQEEKVDLWQKEQKEAEERKKDESLTAAVKQFQGSKEVGKFAVG